MWRPTAGEIHEEQQRQRQSQSQRRVVWTRRWRRRPDSADDRQTSASSGHGWTPQVSSRPLTLLFLQQQWPKPPQCRGNASSSHEKKKKWYVMSFSIVAVGFGRWRLAGSPMLNSLWRLNRMWLMSAHVSGVFNVSVEVGTLTADVSGRIRLTHCLWSPAGSSCPAQTSFSRSSGLTQRCSARGWESFSWSCTTAPTRRRHR